MAWWTAAIVVGVAPVRMWSELEPPFPLRSTAILSGIVTFLVGFAIDIRGTLNFVFASSASRTATMLGSTLAQADFAQSLSDAGPALTLVGFLYFPFFTRLGLFATYLTVSGAVRGISAWFDDPRGDFVLSGIHWAVATVASRNREDRRRIAREHREGAATRDVLVTGHSLGVSADIVVLASRRKDEWTAGATIITAGQWYRLGQPYDLETPAGLRTAYPLTKFDSLEVVRRGIQYELPPLSGRREATKEKAPQVP